MRREGEKEGWILCRHNTKEKEGEERREKEGKGKREGKGKGKRKGGKRER